MRNWIKEMCFKNLTHKQAFFTFLEEMYLSEEEINHPSIATFKETARIYLFVSTQPRSV